MSNTPMSRLKPIVKTFTDTLDRIIQREISLNACAPKYNRYHYMDDSPEYSKGVKNEFIRIFETEPGETFAFTFNNTKKDLDKVLVGISIENNDGTTSKQFKFDEFKGLLKESIKALQILKDVNSLDKDSLYITLERVFKLSEKNEKQTISKLCKDINSETSKLNNEIKKLQVKEVETKKKLSSKKRKLTTKLNEFSKNIDYDKLKAEYEEAQRKFLKAERERNSKKTELSRELNLNSINSEHLDIIEDIEDKQRELSETINQFTRPFGDSIKAKVLNKLSKDAK